MSRDSETMQIYFEYGSRIDYSVLQLNSFFENYIEEKIDVEATPKLWEVPESTRTLKPNMYK